ncbi:MAG: hypothetical protein RR249_09830 [Tannerellaceae bacterium]
MEIENKNVGNENPKEELGNKRVVLSDEQLQEAAGGRLPLYIRRKCNQYFEGCTALGASKEECARKCGY